MRYLSLTLFIFSISFASYNQTINKFDEASQKLTIQESNNIMAFAKLYGYIKYFCPNKLTKHIDWEKYAIYGCRFVSDATSEVDLIARLQLLTYPLASDICIYNKNDIIDSTDIIISKPFRKYAFYKHKGCGIGLSYLYRKLSGYKSVIIKKRYTKSHIKADENLLNKKVYALSSNIYLAMPLAHQWNPNTLNYHHLKNNIDSIVVNNYGFKNINKRSHRLASLIILWNQVEHFFPCPLDRGKWQEGFTEAIYKASEDTSLLDFYFTMGKMMSLLNDFHAIHFATFPINIIAAGSIPHYLPAIECSWIDGHLFVENVGKEYDSLISEKDEIMTINNISTMQYFKQQEQYVSASTSDAKELKVLANLFYNYKKDSLIALQILKPDSSINKINVVTNVAYSYFAKDTSNFLKIMDDSIGYVNFTNRNFSYKSFKKFIKHNQQLKGIICDVRGYPTYRKKVLSHFTKQTMQSTNFDYPLISYPDYNDVSYISSNWKIKPHKPTINCKVVFLTNEKAVSWGETFMDFVKYYKLGTIVGNYTAGTNGNILSFSLPIFDYWVTGMQVKQHNGDMLVGKGIEPDILIRPTYKGYMEGKDEVLDKALEYINTGK